MSTMAPDFISKYFPVGADVEVSQTHPNFQCSWYQAAVVRYAAKGGKSKSYSAAIVVEYRTLRESDELDARYLRETVSPSQLRPFQPKGRHERGSLFREGASVDAEITGGWWEGVITAVLRVDSKYAVFIRGSREVVEFERSMLRAHRDWVEGRWFPDFEAEIGRESECGGAGETTVELPSSPEERRQKKKRPPLLPEQSAQNNILERTFSPGNLVEVSNDEEGLEGSWFTGTIIQELKGAKYLVEYRNLKEESGKDPLREEVSIQNLRPCPPVIRCIHRFEPLERVDARCNGGWWEGIVRKVLANERYSVYFPTSDELLEFMHRDLRVHHEWRNGKWVIPSNS